MQYCQCEHCLKTIPRVEAETFEDRDWFLHFACPEHLADAMLEYARKSEIEKVYAECVES